MSEGILKAAILGINKDARLFLEAIQVVDCLRIEAVADTDSSIAEKTAEEFKCEAFDDYRQLITALDSRLEPENRVLIVAAATYSCEEYIRLAMKKKFHVLKLAPAARDFEEASKFVRLAEDENITFAIANTGRFTQSFNALQEFLSASKIEQIFLITAHCSFSNEQSHSWRNDPKLAGGGVLLHECYRIIDQIICNFGVPEQVYSLQTNQAHDKQQRLYLTEDTAILTMKFSDMLFSNIIASRRGSTGPLEESLQLYGKEKIITVTKGWLIVRDGTGQVLEKFEYSEDKLSCVIGLLNNFSLSILSPDVHKLYSSGRDNLKNMAVLESAYLSARTGFPEEPARILQMVSGATGKVMGV